jgi:hypothetical protein
MAPLVRIAPHLRAVLPPHITFQLVDRRCLRAPHDIERDSLVRVAAEAPDFEIGVPRIERVTERRRRPNLLSVAFDAISARRMRAGVWNTLRSVSTLRALLLMRLDREIDRLRQHRRREDVGQRLTRPACA